MHVMMNHEHPVQHLPLWINMYLAHVAMHLMFKEVPGAATIMPPP